MKTIKIVTLAMFFLSAQFVSNAQGRLRFSDVYLFGGGGGIMTGPLSSTEIKTLESGLFESGIIKPNDKNHYGKFDNKSRTNGQFGIMAGWDVRGTRLGHQKLRIGFSGGSYQLNWDNWKEERNTYRIDTLVSQQSDTQYFIDSTRVKSLSYQHEAQMFNLHLDYLIYLNDQNKLSFYTGLGASAGVSLSNTVTANYREYSEEGNIAQNGYNHNSYGKNNYYNYQDDKGLLKSKDLSPAMNVSAHALVGLNWRLSNKNKFLKHINLYNELNLGLAFNQMEAIESSVGFNVGVQSGLRVSFNNPKTRSRRD